MDIADNSKTDKLGKIIIRDSNIVRRRGIKHLLSARKNPTDWGDLKLVSAHPASRLLHHYKKHGVPVTLADDPWTPHEVQASIDRGPHKSAYEYLDFLREDMADMVDKRFWVVLPFADVKDLQHLRLSPIGVVPQRNRRPRPIVDFTYYGVNDASQPNAPMEAMQFGRTLDRLLRKILLSDPQKGKVYLIKVDLSDGFYRVHIGDDFIARLGVVFPNKPGEPELVALPLRAPMGWRNSPALFCSATETIADTANLFLLRQHRIPERHPLEPAADSRPPPRMPQPLPPDPSLAVPVPTVPDPHLNPARRRRLEYIDVYMDDFLGLAQGSKAARTNVRRVLMSVIDDVFRPNEHTDADTRKEPISVKKLRQGDASWSTQKEVLGWLIDTESMTLRLTRRRRDRLHQILHDELPRSRKRLPARDYHRILGELRSMSLALPGARGLFSVLQEALRHSTPDGRVRLSERAHHVISIFRELHKNLDSRPTRIQELVPLMPTVAGYHDAAGHGAGGVILPTDTAIPRATRVRFSPNGRARIQRTKGPIVWRMSFPKDITDRLATFENPRGDLTNTDLELVGSIVQSEAAVQCFDLRERTHLERTDNLGTMFWQRKGSTTSVKPVEVLLRHQALHQRFHRHVALHDYIPGDLNRAADDASRLQHLSNRAFLHHFNTHYPQMHSWRLWTPTPAMRSWLISVLRNTLSNTASPLHAPPPPTGTGKSGPTSAPAWPSTHSYKTGKTQWSSSKSSSIDTEPVPLPATKTVTPSVDEPLRMPYVRLAKRSLQWGPQTPATHPKAKWISASQDKSVITRNSTRLQTASNPSL